MDAKIELIIVSHLIFYFIPLGLLFMGTGGITLTALLLIIAFLTAVKAAQSYVAAGLTMQYVWVQFFAGAVGFGLFYSAAASLQDGSIFPLLIYLPAVFSSLSLINLVIIKIFKGKGTLAANVFSTIIWVLVISLLIINSPSMLFELPGMLGGIEN